MNEFEFQNATLEQKATAWEWLRNCAAAGGPGWFNAAVLLEELKRVAEPEAGSISPLERYGLAVLDAHRQDIGDLDGGYLQDEAERCGLLYYVEVAEPCGDDCRCVSYDDFPQQCLRLKPEFEPKMSAHRKERSEPQHLQEGDK